ncbi:hypothetical protein AU210_013046 [Fusarium oxysporum f. sp. radicis-cucumerinum]|uniref:FMN hydroxy acid dehydrogenase domain-containing protein n=1 Tax=Fusarium oxysporum f. sp. radicis-cucumerinum TaxID=327505 RepID=A0A2H3GJ32_FUSOX|nr:hypothetical protein AU210_013046 [Fusarium oxysporum f. sp. radicis-cucumerinum]
MTAQQQSLETLLGISSQRKSLKQQLDAASIKAESGRTTLADLPTVQIGCKRYIPEEYIANKNRKGRRSWIQAYGFFLTEVSPDLRTLQTYWACSKCDERGKSSLFVATNTTSPIEHLRRSHMMTEADGNAETRWNSTFMMIQRAIRKREQIDHFITYLDTKAAEPRQRVPVQDHLSQQDWLLLAEIQSLLKPLYEITMRCQGWAKEGRYGALWEVMIGMEYLLNFFEEQKLIFSPPDGTADELQIARASATTRCSPPRADQGRGREKHLPQHTRDEYTGAFSQAESLDDDHRRCIQISINNCWSKLDEYYSLLGQSPLYPAAVILHPRWNVSWLEANWTSHEQLVWLRDAKNSVREFFEQQYPRKEQSEAARTMIGKAIRQDEPSQFDQWMQSYDRYMMEEEDELGVYMRQGPVRRENLNPILWWKEHQEEYPRLSKFALDILAIPAMSVDPERTFSVTKLTISSQRHSLSPEIIEEIQCLRNWLGHQAITVGEVVSFGGDLMGWDGGEAQRWSEEDEFEDAPATELDPSLIMNSTLSWDDIPWFQEITNMSIVLKGVQRVEDVIKAAEYGVQAVIISNHGGRQLDYSEAPIEVLAEAMPILRERGLQGKIEVYIDGGVRRGSDVLKALCLGARGVGIGRPFLYAMAAYGQKGLEKAIRIYKDELERNMRLLGCTSIGQLHPGLVKVLGEVRERL